jgi:hypothetical protein
MHRDEEWCKVVQSVARWYRASIQTMESLQNKFAPNLQVIDNGEQLYKRTFYLQEIRFKKVAGLRERIKKF